nr:pirin family protein [uncultured Brevibacillus sp.]
MFRFGPHPHSDMEIVTVVLRGAIKHEDNLGNVEVTSAGEVQRMSAGSGIIHAEYNASETDDLNFLQLWFMPSERGVTPSFETKRYDAQGLQNQLLPVVSPMGGKKIAAIHQDMTIYLSRLEAAKTLSFSQKEDRRTFLFVDTLCAVGTARARTRDHEVERRAECLFVPGARGTAYPKDLVLREGRSCRIRCSIWSANDCGGIEYRIHSRAV